MSTQNVSFCGEIRKYNNYFWLKKKRLIWSYGSLCSKDPDLTADVYTSPVMKHVQKKYFSTSQWKLMLWVFIRIQQPWWGTSKEFHMFSWRYKYIHSFWLNKVLFWAMYWSMHYTCLFVCVEILQPSQPIGIMLSTVSLLNHFSWADLVL